MNDVVDISTRKVSVTVDVIETRSCRIHLRALSTEAAWRKRGVGHGGTSIKVAFGTVQRRSMMRHTTITQRRRFERNWAARVETSVMQGAMGGVGSNALHEVIDLVVRGMIGAGRSARWSKVIAERASVQRDMVGELRTADKEL